MLDALRRKCLPCTKCGLCETRTKAVFGEGDPKARVMFVGEGPGKTEDLQGRPFVGRSGKSLDKFLAAAGLERSGVYITNIVKCRPPDNRKPRHEEIDRCTGLYLHPQISLIGPEFIVCLGDSAADALISKDFGVEKQHGEFFWKEDYQIMGTFHPAALWHDHTRKAKILEDFLALKAKLKGGGPRKSKT